MKISTNISNKFLICFNEAKSVAIHKKSILKNKNSKHMPYLQGNLIVIFFLFLISIITKFSCSDNCTLCLISILCFYIGVIYASVILCNLICIYRFRKSQNFKNTILLDENGLTDESYYGIKMNFGWEKIKAVVIKKHTIVILTSTPCYFYFNINKKDDILKIVKKYSNLDIVIY